MKRDSIIGLEFDWWATDRDDHVALFSTAGWGEVPVHVLGAYATAGDGWDIDAVVGRLESSSEWRVEAHGPGKAQKFEELGARGIFVFDWKHWAGPYERIVVPVNPIGASTVAEAIGQLTVAHFDMLCFDKVPTIRPKDLVACE